MKGILILLLLAFTSLAQAIDKNASYVEQGARTCGKYIEDRNDIKGVDYVAVQAWIGGYITAFNIMTPDTVSILGNTDLPSALLWLENYCRANPLNSLSAGMVDLTTELYPKRYRSKMDSQ